MNQRMTEDGTQTTDSARAKVCAASWQAALLSEGGRPYYQGIPQPELWAWCGWSCQVAAARWRYRHHQSSEEIERAEGVE